MLRLDDWEFCIGWLQAGPTSFDGVVATVAWLCDKSGENGNADEDELTDPGVATAAAIDCEPTIGAERNVELLSEAAGDCMAVKV
mmetsp:Transcript_5045/g.12939  ORF Transcript_5045/g.12939 Transcript_5045/m.12939 type:complete len:85 (+) Transcript_5045:520-774(+)